MDESLREKASDALKNAREAKSIDNKGSRVDDTLNFSIDPNAAAWLETANTATQNALAQGSIDKKEFLIRVAGLGDEEAYREARNLVEMLRSDASSTGTYFRRDGAIAVLSSAPVIKLARILARFLSFEPGELIIETREGKVSRFRNESDVDKIAEALA
jgi:hypothetical protein